MTEGQVLKFFEDAIKVKGIDKELKKELKETLERVGDEFSFLAFYDIERMLLVPENEKFVPRDVARFIIEQKIKDDPSINDLQKLLEISARPVTSIEGPGVNDHELAQKLYNILIVHDDLGGYDIGNLIIATGGDDHWGNKELARKIAEKGLSDIEDPEALDYIKDIVENELFIGDTELAKKIEEKIKSLK